MNIRESIQSLKDEMTTYRRELHKNPGTAYEEEFASDLIQKKLKEWDIQHENGWAITGVVGTIEGKENTSGKAIALRADIDALDIFEENNKAWVSHTPGKMHGCGHDGHTAMLLGAAKHLKDNPDFNGKIHLIFQPAEEGGGGAYKMIEEGLFEKFKIDEIYGLHNWPTLPKGQVATRTGEIMAASDRFDIIIQGKGGHAAMPHETIDPVVIGSEIVMAMQMLVSRKLDPVDSAVLSITNFHAGTGAFNVIPDHAEISGTLRTFNTETALNTQRRMHRLVENIAQAHGANAKLTIHQGSYAPVINTKEETVQATRVAKNILGESNVATDISPIMGAEDFGAYLLHKPGCFIFMGQAEEDENSQHNQGLHTPQYDFNDEIIPAGIEYWVKLVETALPLK